MKQPILVFGFGNPSRGDDAVGPLLLDYLAQHIDQSRIELLCDFQLQIEHALDIQGRKLVIFVDASVTGDHAFDFVPLKACKDNSYTSHAMSPAALLMVYESVMGQIAPLSYLLSIKAKAFELGGSLSNSTADNLKQACLFAEQFLRNHAAEA